MSMNLWLTLSEVAHQANLSDTQSRGYLKRFGEVITCREFDDVIKFPPETVGLMISISTLCQEGLDSEEILEILREIKGLAKESAVASPSPYLKLVRAILFIVDAQNLALRQISALMQKVAVLLPKVADLIESLSTSEREKRSLRVMVAHLEEQAKQCGKKN